MAYKTFSHITPLYLRPPLTGQGPVVAYKLQTKLLTLMIVFVALAACGGNAEFDEGSGPQSSLLFKKPEDGKLTEKHVVDYITIRQKIIQDVNAQKLAKKMNFPESEERPAVESGLLHFDEIERATAISFNKSYEEYLWIKDKIISAQTKYMVQQYYDLNNRIMTLLDNTLTNYKEVVAEGSDPKKQHKLNGYVDEMKNEFNQLRGKMAGPDDRSGALTHNIQMVKKFQAELETMEQKVSQDEFGTGHE